MDILDVINQLRDKSFEQVIIRARQFPLESGKSKRSNRVPGGTFVQDLTLYKPAIEVQMIACHPRTCGKMGGLDGLVWVSYTNPPPPARLDYKKPLPLRSAVWTGTEEVRMAWNAIGSSWVNCPNWISSKPVVLCRQHMPGEGNVDASMTDVLYLRLLDQLRGKIESHKFSFERKISELAEEIPPNQRGRVYSAWLDVTHKKRSLLGALTSRLETFVDTQYFSLAGSLGITPVKSLELPRE